MKDHNIIEFVDLFLSSPFCRPIPAFLDEDTANAARTFPGLDCWLAPPEMIAGPPDEHGYVPWRPVNSPIDNELTCAIERFLQTTLPPAFKNYLQYKCLIGVDLYEGTLPDIDPRKPLLWLEWSLLESKRHFGGLYHLVPFTSGPANASVLCFDTRQPDPQGDYPINIVPRSSGPVLDEANRSELVGRRVFASFASYLAFLRNWLLYKQVKSSVSFLDWLDMHGKPAPPRLYYEETPH